MVNLFRKNQKVLTFIITVLVIIAFAWLYNSTQFERLGHDTVARIYGQALTHAEVEKQARKFDLAEGLGMNLLVQSLAAPAQSESEARENFVWNSLVLEHEAQALDVAPTDAQVAAQIQQMPLFQTGGHFDFQKYEQFAANNLMPLGFTKAEIEELVRRGLQLERISAILQATTTLPEEEVRRTYEAVFQKRSADLVRLQMADFENQVTVTDDVVQKTFDERSANYHTDEKRAVKFVTFALSPEEAKLPEKEKLDARQRAADRANDVTQALLEKGADFDAAAQKFGAAIQTTEPFAASEVPPVLAAMPNAGRAVFALTPEQPNSDALRLGEGFVIVHLEKIEPSRPLTLEEARPRVIADLKTERAREMMNLKAAEIRRKILDEMKAGKSFADAAQAAGVSATKFPEFSRSEPPAGAQDAMEVVSTASQLKPGAVSELVPTADGGLLIHLEKVAPIDEKTFATEKTLLASRMAGQQRMFLIYEWLRHRREAAQIQGTSKS